MRITRVAIAAPVIAQPPPWNPNDPPIGLSIEEARGRPDGTRLEVTFVGSPRGAEVPCGADYTAEAVESDLAIVVIVVERPSLFGNEGPRADLLPVHGVRRFGFGFGFPGDTGVDRPFDGGGTRLG